MDSRSRRRPQRRWSVAAVLVLLATGLARHLPVAAEGFGQGVAEATTLVEGSPGVDEIQTVAVDATGGTFTLAFEGQTTAPLTFDAAAAEVEAALVELDLIEPDDMTVSGGPGGNGGATPYLLTYGADLGATDVAEVTADASGLAGSDAAVVVATTTPGQEPADEVQQVRVRAVEGTYTLTFDGETTVPLAFDLTAAAVESALEALAGLGPDDVAVGGGPGSRSGSTPYVVTFAGARARTDVPPLSTTGTDLSAVTGRVITELPAGATPTAWSSNGGHLIGTNSLTQRSWWWSAASGYVELPVPPCEQIVPDIPDCSQGTTWHHAAGVNSNGQIAGTVSYCPPNAYGFQCRSRPTRWSAAEGFRFLTDHGTRIGPVRPHLINDQGEITGTAKFPYPDDTIEPAYEAFFWTENEGVVPLGVLPSTMERQYSLPRDINEAGQVIGISTHGPGLGGGFFWSRETGMLDLGTLDPDVGFGDGPSVNPTDINDAGVVVGWAYAPPEPPAHLGTSPVFLWTEADGMTTLSGTRGTHWPIINNAGQITTDVGLHDMSSGERIELGGLGGGETGVTVLGESGAVLGYSATHLVEIPDPNGGGFTTVCDPVTRYGCGDVHPVYWDPEVGLVDLENPSDPSGATQVVPFALSETGEILAYTNAPPPSAESSAPEDPVEIVYWPGPGAGQPDQTLRRSTQTAFAGSRIYTRTGTGQTRSATVRPGATTSFVVRTHNTGGEPASFNVRGQTSANGFRVRYFVGGRNVTGDVAAGFHRTPVIEPRGHRDLTVRITALRGTPIGRTTSVTVRATNPADRTRTDTVRARVQVVRR